MWKLCNGDKRGLKRCRLFLHKRKRNNYSSNILRGYQLNRTPADPSAAAPGGDAAKGEERAAEGSKDCRLRLKTKSKTKMRGAEARALKRVSQGKVRRIGDDGMGWAREGEEGRCCRRV